MLGLSSSSSSCCLRACGLAHHGLVCCFLGFGLFGFVWLRDKHCVCGCPLFFVDWAVGFRLHSSDLSTSAYLRTHSIHFAYRNPWLILSLDPKKWLNTSGHVEQQVTSAITEAPTNCPSSCSCSLDVTCAFMLPDLTSLELVETTSKTWKETCLRNKADAV